MSQGDPKTAFLDGVCYWVFEVERLAVKLDSSGKARIGESPDNRLFTEESSLYCFIISCSVFLAFVGL